MTVFSYFDAAYYVNLDNRPDRREAFERRSKEAGFEAERFSAICPPPTPKNLTTDWKRDHFKLGCTLSQQAVVRLAKERKQKNILVFEDDCVFIPNFISEFPKYVDDLREQSNWDVLYLGGSPEPDFQTKGLKCEQISPNLYYNPGVVWGAHAYAMNEGLFDMFLESRNYPADITLMYIPTNRRRYLMTKEILAYQDEEFESDLWGGIWKRSETYRDNYKKYIK